VRELACLAVAIASACAYPNVALDLPTRGLDASLSGGKGRQVIVIAPFADAREIRERCGLHKNGFNVDSADVVCQSDPTVWLAQLLSDELRRTGFEVLDEQAPHRPGALRIEGSLVKLFVEPVLGVWSASLETDLAVKLRVTTGTGLEAERSFFVKGWKGGVLMPTPQPFHTATQRATQRLLEELTRAIFELLDRYPQLGAGGAPLACVADAARSAR
jgi:hypothetical protein